MLISICGRCVDGYWCALIGVLVGVLMVIGVH